MDELYLTLSPEPLIGKEEFERFYRGEINAVRGEDTVARLSRKLQQAYGAVPLKTFVMGHSGVGKSTELTKLLFRVAAQHRGVRLSIARELNPASFKIFDVLLLMMIRLAEASNELHPALMASFMSTSLLGDLQDWFGDDVVKRSVSRATTAQAEAGAGIKGGSPWASLLGLFASVKADIKYAADRKAESIEYRLKRLPDLIGLCNRVIEICSRALKEREHKEWLLVVEDLDKATISPQQLQDLFTQYGTVFPELRVSIIFTIPVWLGYSSESVRLPFGKHLIHDTPVFDQQHGAHEQGRRVVARVLEARVSPELFEDDLMARLIVASGGNLRDLFFLVQDAGESALVRNDNARSIAQENAAAAINKMRSEYRMRLGQSPYDQFPITYEDKLKKLLAVYQGAPDSEIPDPTLYSLLRARAIQEFNGKVWFGVHPLVVDILKEQGHLDSDAPGGSNS